MKKILFIVVMMFSLNSCASLTTTTTTLIGDVTAYNDNGTILRKWSGVTIEEKVETTQTETVFKTFGLNFYDKNNDKFVIISDAVPYVIEYEVNTTKKYLYPTNNTTTDDKPSKDELRNSWRALNAEYNNIREQMKGMDKNSDEYKSLKTKRNDIQKEKMEVEHLMFKHYNGFIN
jgi:hypothetical protein